MSDPFEIPSKFHEMMSFANVALSVVIVGAGLVFMTQGRDVKSVLIVAPIWALLWFVNGVKERKKRLQRLADVQRLQTRLVESR